MFLSIPLTLSFKIIANYIESYSHLHTFDFSFRMSAPSDLANPMHEEPGVEPDIEKRAVTQPGARTSSISILRSSI
jgi:hypothetical protein